MGLPAAASGDPIQTQDHGPAAPAEDTAEDTVASGLERLESAEARGVNEQELLDGLLLQLRCMAFQRRFDERAAAAPDLGESDSSELGALFKSPEVYRSGVHPERLRNLAAQIAGADRSGTLDGSRATVKGVPPPLSVSGWGKPSAPLIAYVPRAETPCNLDRDTSGAGSLVVDGDFNIWNSFDYAGLLVVLGDITVAEDANLSVDGLPLFTGELKVHHRGRFRVRARDVDLTLIRRTLSGRVPLTRLPLPQIRRVEALTDEQDCPIFAF